MSAERLVHIRRTHRIAVLGESEVGKSTLAERLVQLITDREQLMPAEQALRDARFATESQAGILDEAVLSRAEVHYDNDSTDEDGEEMHTEAVIRLFPHEDSTRQSTAEDKAEEAEEAESTTQARRRARQQKQQKRQAEAKAETKQVETRQAETRQVSGQRAQPKAQPRRAEAMQVHKELYMTTASHEVREHTLTRKVHMREAIVEVVDPIEEGRLVRHTALNPDAAVILFDSDDEDAPEKTENWIHTARGLGAQKVFVVRRRHRKHPKAIWRHRTGRELREKRRKLRQQRRDRFKDRIAKEVFKRAKKMDAERATEETVAKQCIVVAKKAAFKQVNNSCLLL